MKIKLSGIKCIKISDEYIRLDTLLKLASVTSTGGEAKMLIQNGEVFVDGDRCTMRGKKIMPGNIIRYGGNVLTVKCS